jgi:KaiC/GvpD/RAD55 family RecA-like ATPase
MELLSKNIDGKAIILIGPPLVGEKRFISNYVNDLLQKGSAVALILTDGSPEQLKKDLMQEKIYLSKFEDAGLMRYVDSYSRNMGEAVSDTSSIKRVSGPLALNEINIALNEIQKEFLAKSKNHCVVFNSISTLLMYSNASAVARFLQVFVSRIKNAGGAAIFMIEQGMHDEQTIVTLEHLMDAILEMKKEGSKVMIKARGIEGYEDWKEITLFA